MCETPPTKVTLENRRGRTVIAVNGEAISPACYMDPLIRTGEDSQFPPSQWKKRVRRFVDNGVHLFSINPNHKVTDEWGRTRFWTGDGVYPDCSADTPEFCLERQAEFLAGIDPRSRFVVRMSDSVPQAWVDANPGEVQRNPSLGPSSKHPSLASAKGLRDLGMLLRRVIAHCEAQPWAGRVIAYAYYPLGEGVTPLNCCAGLFDTSDAMQRAWSAWLRKRYGTEAAWHRAWGRPCGRFADAAVPDDQAWHAARHDVLHWPDPERHELRFLHDYFEMASELHRDWYRGLIAAVQTELLGRKLFGIDFLKIPMLGWQHNLAFMGKLPGADFLNMLAASGNFRIESLLDDPGLNFVVTPADYTCRHTGFGYEAEGLSDSLSLRGKIMFAESDIRTFAEGEQDDTLGAGRDVPDMLAGMLRNFAWSATRGHLDYWMICGPRCFDNEQVQREGIARLRPLLDDLPQWPHRETEHAIAMVIDDGSPMFEDGTSGFQNLAVIWQRLLGLAHCGIPYRIYLLSDLQHPRMPDYRCYLFPNLFHVDDRTLNLIRAKVFRDGRMAVFGPGTGMFCKGVRSAEGVSQLLGIEMELHAHSSPRRVILEGNHDVVRRLPPGTIYGDSLPYGPIVVPARNAVESAGAETLGWAVTSFQLNRPGLIVKRHADYAAAWSVAMPLPAELLRELSRLGGCHVWCETNDVLLASETVVALHATTAGKRVVRFPSPRPAWDAVRREQLGRRLSKICVDVRPPETHLWLCRAVTEP